MNGANPGWAAGAEWLRAEGEACDVVMSSRVRLARNLAGYPFMTRATGEDRVQVLDLCRRRILSDEFKHASGVDRVMWVDLHEVDKLECDVLVERHLISRQHARGKLSTGKGGPTCARAVAIGLPGERVAVMVNEEDQLRIQVIRSGLALSALLEQVDRIDDALEQGLDYAFHPRFGYLTACPTNIGTGIRCSVMLHLPALKLTGDLERVKRAAEDMSLAVRGFYGEGSDAAGDLYQVSNQTTLGKSEHVLVHELEREIVPRIIDYERHARRTLLEKRRAMIDDKTNRALGVLRTARLLGVEESMQLLSHARLGVLLGLVEGVEQQRINDLMLQVQQAHLQCAVSRELTQQQRRIERADMVRARLAGT
ncbi:MAG: ATP--guanido phosphotransferase [Phycisphaerales bacterium JB058]